MKPASTPVVPTTEEAESASMLTPEGIAELEAFDGGGERVLSVYLDLDPQRQARHAYRIVLEDLAKEIRSRLDRKARVAFQADLTRVQEWLDGQAPHGKGVALFSSEPRKFFRAHWLPVRVRDHLTWEPTPEVAPLIELVDEYERYAVALVEKDRARLFTVFMGAIEESDALRDEEVPPRHDQGGISQSHFQHLGEIATCPACGSAMRPVHDVFHRAMARTIEQADRVEVVHGDAARRLRESGSGLGALLRFRAVTAPILA